MNAHTSRSPRTVLLAVVVGLLAVASAPAGAAEQVRTETALGGYRIDASASPLLVLLDDPSVPIPRPPGAALLEADPSFTKTSLTTGPQSRAVASSLWPGTLLGDGLNTATEGQAGDYPVQADARFPGGPETEVLEPVPGSGAGMFATASGLDVAAEARSGASPNPETLGVGQAQSRSSSTTVEGVGIASATADVTDVSLMAGLIKVQQVRSTLETRSDGTTGSSTGTTTVSGLEIAGMGYTVDEQGVRPVDQGQPGQAVLPGLPANPAADPLTALGFTVEPVGQSETVEGSTVSRTAKGLRITVDTALLNSVLRQTPLPDQLGPVFGQAPAEMQGALFYLLSATPKVTYVFAWAAVSSATSLPIVFDFPSLAPFPLAPAPIAVAPPFNAGFSAPAVLGAPPRQYADTAAPGDQPAVAGAIRSVAAPREAPAAFAGIAAGLVLLGLLFAAGGGRALMALRALALGAVPLGKGCALGASGAVPDLRGA